MATVSIGENILAKYNSGKYIGEVMEDRGDRYLVKVLAVQKHPMQGDLHNLGETEGVFFHDRKAMAHYEKINIPKSAVRSHEGAVPDYRSSLQEALEDLKQKLSEKDDDYNKKALERLQELEENDYTKSYYN